MRWKQIGNGIKQREKAREKGQKTQIDTGVHVCTQEFCKNTKPEALIHANDLWEQKQTSWHIRRQHPKRLLSLLAMGFSIETHLEKMKFSFVSGYQLGWGRAWRPLFSSLSPCLVQTPMHAATVSEFIRALITLC